ncbi:Ubiquitin receptor RAD23b [Porphyridium purpureum]|uniref:UV excision repair protein RAD23 n=1 Tax=Porphyridium purpureum TaxID=35688 RepID=A0A5J4YT12_PORPP|nr:Ubiquitin receptor RAD23b [Porphyridium purpureum]|eukprot:POR4593..scf236_6
MKVSFKTLQGKQFKLDLDGSESVLDAKRKVGNELQYENPTECRLIFLGKVLSDSASVQDSGITEAGVVVVMPPKKVIAKPKSTAPAAGGSTSVSTATAAGLSPDASAPHADAKPKPEPAEPTGPASSLGTTVERSIMTPAANPPSVTTAAAPTPVSTADIFMGEQFESSVQNIMMMGFSDEQLVRRALRAAYNNPDRAVEYLCSGSVPEVAEPEPVPASPAGALPMASTTAAPPSHAPATDNSQPFNMFAPEPRPESAAGGGTGGAGGGSMSLDFLRSVPQFTLMRRMIQSNPALLSPLLQQLGQANPALLQMISENQTEFVRLINEPLTAAEEAALEQFQDMQGGDLGADFGEGGLPAAPPGTSVIQVTEEERAQIERLEEMVIPMGIDRAQVIEAWLACDRNEEMAANYLLENMDDLRGMNDNDGDSGAPPDM